jgi:hypothetical protein
MLLEMSPDGWIRTGLLLLAFVGITIFFLRMARW